MYVLKTFCTLQLWFHVRANVIRYKITKRTGSTFISSIELFLRKEERNQVVTYLLTSKWLPLIKLASIDCYNNLKSFQQQSLFNVILFYLHFVHLTKFLHFKRLINISSILIPKANFHFWYSLCCFHKICTILHMKNCIRKMHSK